MAPTADEPRQPTRATSGTATPRIRPADARLSRWKGRYGHRPDDRARGILRRHPEQTAALRAAVDALSILVLEDLCRLRPHGRRTRRGDKYVDEVIDVVRARSDARPEYQADRVSPVPSAYRRVNSGDVARTHRRATIGPV